MLASEKGHTQTIELLLKHNVDANVQDKEGRTALIVARKKGHQRIVELLDPVTKQTQVTDTPIPVTNTNDAINTDTSSLVCTPSYDTMSSSAPTSTTHDQPSITDTGYQTISSFLSVKDRLVQAVKHPFSSFDNKSKKNINIENKEQTQSIYQQLRVNSRGTQRPSIMKRMFRRQRNVTLVQYKT